MKIRNHFLTRLIIVPCMVLFMFCSCGSSDTESKSSDNHENVESSDVKTKVDIDNSEWNGWEAPANLDGYALDALVVDPYKNMDMYSALAVYKKGDQVIRIQVVDGSTEKGQSEIRDHLKIVNQNVNYESEYGYEKTIERNGIKAKEDFLKTPGEYLIKFMLKDKYGVSIKSNATSAEAVWKLVDRANLESLK